MKAQRLNAVLEQMKKDDISQMLVSDPTSIFYLTGVLIHPGERLLALYLNLMVIINYL
ncbi:creatinase/Prolidase N-terminal domain protein [Clostridioides difficile P70]|nr:aminopeptidase P family N-terminal domain-containing protein [Clostridioides difficile]EQK15189.1 creatinase/Prolidase N-terminal domain protein [Clostridioides difficile P70]